MYGVFSANKSLTVNATEMEAEFGAKVSGEYKLSGCTDGAIKECYRWFLEALWLQAKTYTLSVRVKHLLKIAELKPVAWARVLKDRIRAEAQRICVQVQRGHTVHSKVGQILQALFPASDIFLVALQLACYFLQ